KLGRDGINCLLASARGDNLSASIGKTERDAPANSGSAAKNDRYFPRETEWAFTHRCSTSRSKPNRSGTWNVSLIVGCQAISLRLESGPWLRKKFTRNVLPAEGEDSAKADQGIFLAPYQIFAFLSMR